MRGLRVALSSCFVLLGMACGLSGEDVARAPEAAPGSATTPGTGTTSWTAASNQAYANFGVSVSAPGLSTAASWTAGPDQASARSGVSVSAAGDVNGDGDSDVTVGAFAYDNGETDEGRAYV